MVCGVATRLFDGNGQFGVLWHAFWVCCAITGCCLLCTGIRQPQVRGLAVVSFRSVGSAEQEGCGGVRAHMSLVQACAAPAHLLLAGVATLVNTKSSTAQAGFMLQYGSCPLCMVQLLVCVCAVSKATHCMEQRWHEELPPLSVGDHWQCTRLGRAACLSVARVGYIRISIRGCLVNPYPVKACLEAAPSRLLHMVGKAAHGGGNPRGCRVLSTALLLWKELILHGTSWVRDVSKKSSLWHACAVAGASSVLLPGCCGTVFRVQVWWKVPFTHFA